MNGGYWLEVSIIVMSLDKGIQSEVLRWRGVLRRIIDVVLFMGEHGLSFHGTSQRIGSSDNGHNGAVESLYDSVLRENVEKVRIAQESGERMSALQIHKMNSLQLVLV